MRRYTIHYIATVECDSLRSEILASADDADEARALALQHAGMGTYGAGIRDTETGEIDVGFGFGVLCPREE